MDFEPVNPLQTLSAIGVSGPENEKMLRFLEGHLLGDPLGNWVNPLEMTDGGVAAEGWPRYETWGLGGAFPA
jgi:hypothetical protein